MSAANAKDAILRAGRGIRWYFREASGESKWDEYVADCRERGVVPRSRREFERRRADQRDHDPRARCC
jgi:hypothetical protein